MHLIVQLKENQPNLRQKAEAARADAKPLSSVQTVDAKRRNRHETRTIAVFDPTNAVKNSDWETHVSAIIHVERAVYHAPSRHRSLEILPGNLVLFVQSPARRRNRRRRHPQALGDRKHVASYA